VRTWGPRLVLATEVSRVVIEMAGTFEAILGRRARTQRDDLLDAADCCEQAFGRLATEINDRARYRLRLGQPPSLRDLTGISNLEVPMNQVLGWILNPEARGRSALVALDALARLLDFPALIEDIREGQLCVVHVEKSPGLKITNRQPDLMIGSANAAVLIENKVGSPESDPDQYAEYLQALRQWAGPREFRAYLLAPSARKTPDGWTGSLSHRQLAHALRPLVIAQDVALWDRIIYGLIVSDLDPDSRPDRSLAIERLVSSSHPNSCVTTAMGLAQLLRHPAVDPTDGGF